MSDEAEGERRMFVRTEPALMETVATAVEDAVSELGD